MMAHQLPSRTLKDRKFPKVTLCICSLLYLLPVGRGGIIHNYAADWLKFVSPVGYSFLLTREIAVGVRAPKPSLFGS